MDYGCLMEGSTNALLWYGDRGQKIRLKYIKNNIYIRDILTK